MVSPLFDSVTPSSEVTRRISVAGTTWTRFFLLACVMLVAAGCGGGGGGPAIRDDPPATPSAPTTSNPVGLGFRSTELGTPAPPDGKNYRTPEFLRHHGLDAISADGAYERGYFGQGVTIAIADDGMDLTHPDLADKITMPRHIRNRDSDVFEHDAERVHGTYVALLAAGARGENPGAPYEIAVRGSAAIPMENVHGVAPDASVMPIQISGSGPLQAIRYAVNNQAPVLNFSIGIGNVYYGEYAGRDGVWLTTSLPAFAPIMPAHLRHEFAEVAQMVEDDDIVMVWGGGNDGWNSVNNEIRMCGKNFAGEGGVPPG